MLLPKVGRLRNVSGRDWMQDDDSGGLFAKSALWTVQLGAAYVARDWAIWHSTDADCVCDDNCLV